MSAIPGLQAPDENVPSVVAEEKGIRLISFDLKPFTVPEAQRYGKCRLISEFEKICQIGEGTFGIVYKVKDSKTDEIVALKKLKIRKKAPCLPLNFVREITILKSLHHDNIVNMSGLAVGRLFESTYLILEYCPYELSKVIDDDDAKALLDQSQVKCIIHQLFTGLNYIHKRFVLHRDITVTNILFTEIGVLKIADFGMARMVSEDQMTPEVVSRWYRAPELLFGSNLYTSAIDVWSATCVFAELLLKKPLFKTESDNDMIAAIVEFLSTPTEETWPGVSALPLMQIYDICSQPCNRLKSTFKGQPDACIGLFEKLFVYDPRSRFTAEECLSHTYFTDEPLGCDLNTLLITLKKPQEI